MIHQMVQQATPTDKDIVVTRIMARWGIGVCCVTDQGACAAGREDCVSDYVPERQLAMLTESLEKRGQPAPNNMNFVIEGGFLVSCSLANPENTWFERETGQFSGLIAGQVLLK